MAELFTNEASTTVSSGGTTAPAQGTSESWTVASSASFPAISGAQTFHVADPASGTTAAEIIAVTAVSGTAWTVTRGAESTTPVAHGAGFTVQQVISAASLSVFAQAGNGDLGGTGAAPTVTATHLASALPVAQGGTGQTGQQAAMDTLAGGTASATFLRGNGTHAVMAAIQAADVPTLNQNTTGTAAGLSATLAIGSGGTGQVTAAAAYNALSPMSTLGDIEYESGANTAARLAGNTTSTKNFLTQTGTGSVSAAPAWGTIASADMPTGTTGAKGALQLDGTAADITAITTALAAGVVGKAADAGHAHVSPLWLPADNGLLGWAYDPATSANSSSQPAAGTVIAVRMRVPAGTITNLWVGINSAGSGLTSGQNFAGLYSSDGQTLLSATADQSTAWTSGFTAVSMALTTPQTVSAGYVYVAWYANGTTVPKFQWNGSANHINANLANATARFAHGGTGRTTSLPASLTLTTNGDSYWAAVN